MGVLTGLPLLALLGSAFVLAGIGAVLHFVPGAPDLRRRIIPWYYAGAAGFTFLIVGLGSHWSQLLLALALAAVVAGKLALTSGFCDRCGVITSTRGFSIPDRCARCGHAYSDARDGR
ncbi:hypothetical protein AZA_90196 [Nitrospirillum viridazoti Y2]|uniref:Uncharacterized protein n=1 Tax=Nitrospirillum amazonense TaxID=28077 RepID=A0A560HXP9_9PROT|nr:hypothetical protein [Nitrospirillum amazonense]EGX99584.1 hypothetical protein AZA_90196 [Nitrospirillum amazonense Y2]TWB51426.1 hypothetical protein FBZ92_12019 [Nitrospirillum amazonense]